VFFLSALPVRLLVRHSIHAKEEAFWRRRMRSALCVFWFTKKKEPCPHSGLLAFHRRLEAMPHKFDSDKNLKENAKNNLN